MFERGMSHYQEFVRFLELGALAGGHAAIMYSAESVHSPTTVLDVA